MAGNTFLTPADITYRAAARFMNSMRFGAMIDRQYNDRFARSGAKIGNSLAVRLPPRFIVSRGPVAVLQDIEETYVDLTLNQYLSVPLNYTSEDLTLWIDDFDNRILAPAVEQLANEVDAVLLELVVPQVHHAVGTPGTRPADSQLFLDAKATMRNEACPMDLPWQALLSPLSEASMVKALQGLFNDQATLGEQYKRGSMGTALGFDWDVDQNMPTHTVGVQGGTPLVNGAGQTGSSIITDGWTGTTGALAKGDIITFDGVFGVNPLSRRSTAQLQQFVVTEAATADSSGNMTIKIYPALVPPAANGDKTQKQTVTASAANNAPITVLGTTGKVTPQNLCFYPKFCTAGFADLALPESGTSYRVSDPEMGISIRLWKDSDWYTDTHGTRLDVLFGVTVPRPMWACRVAA